MQLQLQTREMPFSHCTGKERLSSSRARFIASKLVVGGALRRRARAVYRREVSGNATFDRNGDNFKTCFFNNSFERVDNGASVNVVNLVRYLPHPDSGCKSCERRSARAVVFTSFEPLEGRK